MNSATAIQSALKLPRNEVQPKTIAAGRLQIGDGQPCFITAEIGQNHNGDMKIAKKLIDMAAFSEASAVKFQKRDVESELSVELCNKPYDNENSFGKTYGEHRKFLELTAEQHRELQQYAAEKGILYFCTICDLPSLNEMAPLDLPLYKVASRDITNWPLLEELARFRRPVILSTGMAGPGEVDAAVDIITRYHDDFVIAQCTSEYPSPPEHCNLTGLRTYRERYGCLVGMSDHTAGVIVAVAAATMGACFVEKHVTLSRAMRGTDHAGSLEIEGLRRVVGYIRQVEAAMGTGDINFHDYMAPARQKLAKSLSCRRDLSQGEELREEDLELRCPGTGIRWSDRHRLVGKQAACHIDKHNILDPKDFI